MRQLDKILSFMNALISYNQIKMHKANQEKKTFLINQWLYYYKVMFLV